jgi:AcrR family transcriptional regulator
MILSIIERSPEIVMALSRHDINRERTIQSIEDAFLAEYTSKGIEGISITTLCKNSGVSRSTFYLYFDDKYAVLENIEKRLLDDFIQVNQDMPYISDLKYTNPHPQQVLEFIFENEKWFKALLGPHGDPGFHYRWKKSITKTLNDRLARKHADKESLELQGAIFSSGLIGLFTYILFEKPNVSNELLGQYMTKLLHFTCKL